MLDRRILRSWNASPAKKSAARSVAMSQRISLPKPGEDEKRTSCPGFGSTLSNFPDPADRASQEEEFSLELRARDRERKLIKKIDETLQLIEDNEYGWCDSCGVEIGIRRLEARPTATLCIDCKTLAEIKEKQIGS